MTSRVVITIVVWNSMKFLPDALASIMRQTFQNFSVIIIDNASTDGVVEFVRREYPQVMILRNSTNLGFSRGHNQGITYARAHFKKDDELFVLVTNPDIMLSPDYLEIILKAVEPYPEVGSATGKLLKVQRTTDGEIASMASSSIDSMGLRMHHSRRITERGSGETDNPSRTEPEEIFGVSGALALYRMSALEDVMFRQEYFDEDFFVYKEDVDLAWRLRLRGWSAMFVPQASAYHYRTAYGKERVTLGEMVRGRRRKSPMVNFFSHRNHGLLLVKNEHCINALLDIPRIAWYEMTKFFYILFMEPTTLRAVPAFWRMVPRMLVKRRYIMKRTRVKSRDIRRWFV